MEILDWILREFFSSFITSMHTPSSTKDSSDTSSSSKVVGSDLEAQYNKDLNLKEHGLGVDREWWGLKWKGWKEWVMAMELEEKEGVVGWGNRKTQCDSGETGMARIVSVVLSS